jgi:transposase
MVLVSSVKQHTLHHNGTLNPRPDAVHDGLFHTSDFFDAYDLLQVRYEMLRRVALDGWSVTQATHAFGCSRPVFYHARTAFEHEGLTGLIPRKRGPKDAYKLSADVMAYVMHVLQDTPHLSSQQLTQAIVEHFGRLVHPRSIGRAVARHEKKGGLGR